MTRMQKITLPQGAVIAPYTIGRSTILRLPKRASLKLPSRGQVALQGTESDNSDGALGTRFAGSTRPTTLIHANDGSK